MRQSEKIYFDVLDSMTLGKKDQVGYEALNQKYLISDSEIKFIGDNLLKEISEKYLEEKEEKKALFMKNVG